MRNLIPGVLLATLLLSACSSRPPQPDWKKDSVSYVQKYNKAELKGENTLAERYFELALSAAAQAGGLEETARLHLIRCATRQASLTFAPCPAYQQLTRLAPNAEDAAYQRFINGDWEGLDSAKLPAQYRDFFSSQDTQKRIQSVEKIADPLSRLIAISIAIQRKQSDPALLNMGAETASAQGWRKPLLVYLKLLEQQSAGDTLQQESLRARIKLVEDSFR